MIMIVPNSLCVLSLFMIEPDNSSRYFHESLLHLILRY